MEPVPFVVGVSRSGTTLLRAMLDSHPSLAIPPESHFILRLLDEPYDRRRFVSLLEEHPRFARWRIPPADVEAALEREPPSGVPDAIRVLFMTYARARSKPRWGDKTPDYVTHLPKLAAAFPEARFIHVIRDGRDVALSWVQASFGPSSVGDAAQKWKRRIKLARRAAEDLGERYTEVRYEDLVRDPEAVLSELCSFVALPFDASMLRYTERAEEIIGGTRAPELHQGVKRPPTPGLRDWRTEMDPADVRAFEEVAGGMLSRLGYPLSRSI